MIECAGVSNFFGGGGSGLGAACTGFLAGGSGTSRGSSSTAFASCAAVSELALPAALAPSGGGNDTSNTQFPIRISSPEDSGVFCMPSDVCVGVSGTIWSPRRTNVKQCRASEQSTGSSARSISACSDATMIESV